MTLWKDECVSEPIESNRASKDARILVRVVGTRMGKVEFPTGLVGNGISAYEVEKIREDRIGKGWWLRVATGHPIDHRGRTITSFEGEIRSIVQQWKPATQVLECVTDRCCSARGELDGFAIVRLDECRRVQPSRGVPFELDALAHEADRFLVRDADIWIHEPTFSDLATDLEAARVSEA